MADGIYLVIGAYGGIGTELCRWLVKNDLKPLLAGPDPDKLTDLAEALDCSWKHMDATETASLEALFRSIELEGIPLRGVAHLAGTILLKPAHRTSDEEWAETINKNLTSAFKVVRHASQAFGPEGGSIVLMSSVAAYLGLANHDAIAAAKAGVEGLVRSAAATYASKKIRINAVAPGLVNTPLAEAITKNALALKASTAMHPLKRIGTAVEIASAIGWLLNNQQSWITGQVIRIDGGMSSVKSTGN
jgi:3-oxoacyl-[acyl-carrier protein] reductase